MKSKDLDILAGGAQEPMANNLDAAEQVLKALEEIGDDTLASLKAAKLESDALFADPEIGRAVFDAVSDAIVISDQAGLIRLVNRRAEVMFGYDPGDLGRRALLEIIPEEYHQRHLARQAEYFKNPMGRSMRDLRGLRKDGTTFDVLISLRPVKAAAGVLVIATLREVQP